MCHGDVRFTAVIRMQTAESPIDSRPVGTMTKLSHEMEAAVRLGYISESAAEARHTRKPSRPPPYEIPPAGIKYVRASDVAPKPIRWLWPNRIAQGKLTLFAGDPGLGKSILTCALAATVSRGAEWPDRSGRATRSNVVMLSDEDAVDDTIRPRLDAAEADCSRVFCATMVQDFDEDGPRTRTFSLQQDVELLREMVYEIGDVSVIFVDPVSAYLGATDSHKNSDVRGVLSPLAELAVETGAAIVLVTHLNKGGGSAMYRAIGSIAFMAAARAGWAVTKDKDQPSRRLVLPIKNNLGNDQSGLAYDIQTAANDAAVIRWEPNPVTVDVDDALGRPLEGNDGSALDDATLWLSGELDGGPQPQSDLRKLAAREGHSWRTVRRAKDALGVVSKKDLGPRGQWRWWLPEDAPSETVATLGTLPESLATPRSQQHAQGGHVNGTGAWARCAKCDGEGCPLCRPELGGVNER